MTFPVLSFPSSSYYSWPYTIAIIAVFLAVLIMLVASKSFRNYRRKRNVMVYGIIILVLALLMFQSDSVSRRAMVHYQIGAEGNKAYAGETNQIVLSCSNSGGRAASLYLTVSAVNASFLLQNQQDYVLVSNTTIKVPFSLSWNSDNKPVAYIVDDNATGFSFSASLENRGYGGLDVGSGTTSMTFVWNATCSYYVVTITSGFVV